MANKIINSDKNNHIIHEYSSFFQNKLDWLIENKDFSSNYFLIFLKDVDNLYKGKINLPKNSNKNKEDTTDGYRIINEEDTQILNETLTSLKKICKIIMYFKKSIPSLENTEEGKKIIKKAKNSLIPLGNWFNFYQINNINLPMGDKFFYNLLKTSKINDEKWYNKNKVRELIKYEIYLSSHR